MNPTQALAVRSKCVEYCRMPALAIALSLDHTGRTDGAELQGDMVAFVSGILILSLIKIFLLSLCQKSINVQSDYENDKCFKLKL